MRKPLAPTFLGVVAALALALVSPATGEEALYLDWDECGPSGPLLHTSACDSDLGSQSLYCAFTLAQPLDQVVGVEITVDLNHTDATLPPWWQLGVGGCRFGALTADGGSPAGGSCTDFWGGQATGGLQGYAVGQPYGGLNQARIRVALSLLPADARSLAASTLYYAGRIVLGNQGTTLTCPGCGAPACLVLNTIVIKRLPGAPGGDVSLSIPAVGNGNMATWQSGAADCSAVPIRRVTWGSIKALYR